MTTKDLILDNLDQLPPNIWTEVLNFVLFLRHKQEEAEEQEDLADAQAALAEEGFIPLSQVRQELGL